MVPYPRLLYTCRVLSIQPNPMSITEAGQRPLFPSLSKHLKYITQINSEITGYVTLPLSIKGPCTNTYLALMRVELLDTWYLMMSGWRSFRFQMPHSSHESRRFLNMLTEVADTIWSGRAFQCLTVRWLKKCDRMLMRLRCTSSEYWCPRRS